MKKIAIGLVLLLAVSLIYYLTLGSTQIINEMKKHVEHELTVLSDNGFTIEERVINPKDEHFVIQMKDTDKITNYVQQQNIQASPKNIGELQDFKLAVNISYLPTASDAFAMEVYPLNLPKGAYSYIGSDDNGTIEILEKMIKEKVFVTHINVNKLLSGFNGYLKDVNETFTHDNNITTLTIQDFTFNGALKNQKISSANQELKLFSYHIKDLLELKLTNLKSHLQNPMNSGEQVLNHTLDTVSLTADNDEGFSLIIKDTNWLSKDHIKDTLLTNQSKFKISTINLDIEGKQQKYSNIQLDASLRNLDLNALERLQQFSSKELDDNETIAHMMPILKAFTKSNASFEISEMSIASIIDNNKSYNGFKLKASSQVNKEFEWDRLEEDPLMIANVFDAKVNLTLSNEIVHMLAEDPKAMLFMMMIQPIENNGSKTYDVEFVKGSLKINGTPLL
ncbi:MAG: YdgA family protein [Epsilonproteobacteria bacterium]|nr:YdgA family protein [Campylobacterota bacterium]